MVKIQKPSDYDALDVILRKQCEQFAFRLGVEGWTRKTYDVYLGGRNEKRVRIARIESFATTNGEIRVYDDRGMAFAEALGKELEQTFSIPEAVILREQPTS